MLNWMLTTRPPLKNIEILLILLFSIAQGFGLGLLLQNGGDTRRSMLNTVAAPDCRDIDNCSVRVTPKDVLIHFMDPSLARKLDPTPLAVAFTYIARNPCEIVVPAVGSIDVHPRVARANWNWNNEEALGGFMLQEVLAHELAHCFAGSWHIDSTPVIFFNREYLELHSIVDREDYREAQFINSLPLLPFHLWEHVAAPHVYIPQWQTNSEIDSIVNPPRPKGRIIGG